MVFDWTESWILFDLHCRFEWNCCSRHRCALSSLNIYIYISVESMQQFWQIQSLYTLPNENQESLTRKLNTWECRRSIFVVSPSELTLSASSRSAIVNLGTQNWKPLLFLAYFFLRLSDAENLRKLSLHFHPMMSIFCVTSRK
jgi:hypothetical protein